MQVLITRPQPHAITCQALLATHGIRSLCAPQVSIAPSDELDALRHMLSEASAEDLIIAVSQYAVQSASDYLYQQGLRWPTHLRYLAVGQATAQCWQQTGVNAHVPSLATSEGMLACLRQWPHTQRVWILRGQQGREWLGNELSQRGLQVDYICCYQRQFINYSPQNLAHWQQHINCISATSGEIVYQLCQQSSDAHYLRWLHACELIVPSQRVVDYARQLGFNRVILSQGASNQACLETLLTLSHRKE